MKPRDSGQQRENLIDQSAQVLVTAFDDYNAGFGDFSRRARRRFLKRDRAGMRSDANARYDLYEQSIAETLSRLEQVLGERLYSPGLWADIHRAYGREIAGRVDVALYKTFFNSLSRRLFRTQGVNPRLEFLARDIEPRRPSMQPHNLTSISGPVELERYLEGLLENCELGDGLVDSREDARRLASGVTSRLEGACPDAIGFLEAVFYREGRAFLVGSMGAGEGRAPCVIALVCDHEGVRVDAVIVDAPSVSVLFGFSHSPFLVDLPRVEQTVGFLQTILPNKTGAELYTVMGRIKQGKTERYRHFFDYLENHPTQRFVHAAGQPGMVMLVFNLPGYPLVFKVIRDRFAPSKKFGRRHVLDKYRLVSRHDRVGRLLDTQEFKRLVFPADQFSPDLLDELVNNCARSVRLEGNSLIIGHCYVQQRLKPLDMVVGQVEPDAADRVVLEYGRAIVDLACCNLFAGDLLLKNFGLTGNQRAVFYDYDELALLTDCRFRTIPEAPSPELEMADESWFPVDQGDVFPEQFERFMGLPPARLLRLKEALPELFDVSWWQQTGERIRSTGVVDVPPYRPSARLAQGTKS